MAQTMFYGTSEEETYSSVILSLSGVYYDHIKEGLLRCLAGIVDKRIKDGSKLLSIADFGTADGATFHPLLEEIFQVVEGKNGGFQTMVYLEDRIENDFNVLFSKLGALQNKKKNVFFSAIGKSMFEQCLPNQSVDIAVSTVAAHWLSKRPCCVENGVSFLQCNAEELAKFQEQARQDWHKYILIRGRELKKGGYIFTLMLSVDGGCISTVYINLTEALKRMRSSGKITKEEFYNTTVMAYPNRTKADFSMPFEDPEIRSLGLSLVSVEKRLHCSEPLLNLKNGNDKPKYMKAGVDFVQSFTRMSVRYGLSDDRTEEEKDKVVDEVFERLYDVLMETDADLSEIGLTEVVVKKE